MAIAETGASIADHIMAQVTETPGLTDRELTDRIKGAHAHPSQINQECRYLEQLEKLVRQKRSDGRIGNYPVGIQIPVAVEIVPPDPPTVETQELSEDQVKAHLKTWLEADGWRTEIAWGKARGVDIAARRDGKTWLIEAKGCGSRPEMRVNYFISMLGELLQRMADPDARYSIALPDLQPFRGLWDRLPALARQRTSITAIFVSADGKVHHLAGAQIGEEK